MRLAKNTACKGRTVLLPAVNSQLPVNARPVGMHGRYADLERLRDLFIALVPQETGHDRELGSRKRGLHARETAAMTKRGHDEFLCLRA